MGRNDSVLLFGSKLTCFVCAGGKSLVFCVWGSIDLVFVWVVEIDLVFVCRPKNTWLQYKHRN